MICTVAVSLTTPVDGAMGSTGHRARKRTKYKTATKPNIRYEKEIRVVNRELKKLKSKINKHFFFA
jgi:uncharacterized protein YlxW (UPF0749 family)